MINRAFYETKLNKLNIEIDIADRSDSLDDKAHLEIVKRISSFYSLMKKEQGSVKSVWQPAGEWQNYNEEKDFFYRCLLEGKHQESSDYLKNFWRNDLGLIVKEYARYSQVQANDKEVVQPFMRSIGRNFLIWKDIFQEPTKKLALNNYVGNPWGCRIDGELIIPKATRFHSNALQIRQLLDATGGLVVGEIGAGYGGLANYLFNEVPNLRYLDFDLPETLAIAAYYLTLILPEEEVFLYGDEPWSDNLLNKYSVFLLPNYFIDQVKDKSVDVFFNSFSLSEMPKEVNKTYLSEIARLTSGFFLHNNMDRVGVINRGFERIPASEYPIDQKQFSLLSKNYDLFHSHFGDYKEFLYSVK